MKLIKNEILADKGASLASIKLPQKTEPITAQRFILDSIIDKVPQNLFQTQIVCHANVVIPQSQSSRVTPKRQHIQAISKTVRSSPNCSTISQQSKEDAQLSQSQTPIKKRNEGDICISNSPSKPSFPVSPKVYLSYLRNPQTVTQSAFKDNSGFYQVEINAQSILDHSDYSQLYKRSRLMTKVKVEMAKVKQNLDYSKSVARQEAIRSSNQKRLQGFVSISSADGGVNRSSRNLLRLPNSADNIVTIAEEKKGIDFPQIEGLKGTGLRSRRGSFMAGNLNVDSIALPKNSSRGRRSSRLSVKFDGNGGFENSKAEPELSGSVNSPHHVKSSHFHPSGENTDHKEQSEEDSRLQIKPNIIHKFSKFSQAASGPAPQMPKYTTEVLNNLYCKFASTINPKQQYRQPQQENPYKKNTAYSFNIDMKSRGFTYDFTLPNNFLYLISGQGKQSTRVVAFLREYMRHELLHHILGKANPLHQNSEYLQFKKRGLTRRERLEFRRIEGLEELRRIQREQQEEMDEYYYSPKAAETPKLNQANVVESEFAKLRLFFQDLNHDLLKADVDVLLSGANLTACYVLNHYLYYGTVGNHEIHLFRPSKTHGIEFIQIEDIKHTLEVKTEREMVYQKNAGNPRVEIDLERNCIKVHSETGEEDDLTFPTTRAVGMMAGLKYGVKDKPSKMTCNKRFR